MLAYLIKRLLYGLIVLFGVTLAVFVLFQGLGDPAKMILGQSGDSTTLANIRKELSLDAPKWKQFALYCNDISPLSIQTKEEIRSKKLEGRFIAIGSENTIGIKWPYLRQSYQSKKPVSAVLMEALPGTIILTITAMFIATISGIGFGILAATHKDSILDRICLFIGTMGISAPSFFTGIIIAYIFGFVWKPITGLSMTGNLYQYGLDGKSIDIKNLILPAVTLGIRPLAVIMQLSRSSMTDTLSQPFIRTANAKGLTENKILLRHALPNALNPVITTVTGWFAELLAGAFFVEYIFGWQGIGKVTVEALNDLDFPVVMGSVLLTSTLFILVNILTDILYAWIDPRLRTH